MTSAEPPGAARKAPFRILALNGGGARGIFQARYLSKLLTGRTPRDCFDLVAGTSTGAILGLAVTLGVDLNRVYELYKTSAEEIFPPRKPRTEFFTLVKSLWTGCGSPRFSSDILKKKLEEVFEGAELDECRPRLIVPATTTDSFGHHTFDSMADPKLKAVDVALASGAAPSYFPAATLTGNSAGFADGGLWANTPSLLAVLLAHGAKPDGPGKRVPFENMRVLSVGNGKVTQGRPPDDFNSEMPLDLLGLTLEMMFAAQSTSADELVAQLIGPRNIVVVNPDLPVPIELDDAKTAIDRLPGLAEGEAGKTRSEVEELLELSPVPIQG